MNKEPALELEYPGCEFWLLLFTGWGLRPKWLSSLNLNFLICKMRINDFLFVGEEVMYL